MSFTPSSLPLHAIEGLLRHLELPKPIEIKKSSAQGAYHLIYILVFESQHCANLKIWHSLRSDQQPRLLLRVSGGHLPSLKTENESATLIHLARSTHIPVPRILYYSSSTDNPLGHEYQLMSVEQGEPVDLHFRSFDDTATLSFLDQMADILKELHNIPSRYIGGSRLETSTPGNGVFPSIRWLDNYGLAPAPLCEEFMWQIPSIAKSWHSHGLNNESPSTLNAQGPFETCSSYLSAWLNKYIYAISLHPLLSEMRDLIPHLHSLVALLSDPSFLARGRINEMRLVLAHRDLHFSNILWDPATKRITSILDWEFSGVTPFCRWDPPKAFLASQPWDEEGILRKRKWVQMFQDRCEEREVEWRELIWDGENKQFGWKSEEQELVFRVVNLVRCICEVGPTGERKEGLGRWRKEFEEGLGKLGI